LEETTLNKVVFILTEPTRHIVGGYKMVYLYANALIRAGFEVEIVYRCYKRYSNLLMNSANHAFRYALTKKRIGWYPLSAKVKRRLAYHGLESIHDCIVFATAAKTAKDVWEHKIQQNNKVFYLIQDYETWTMSETMIDETFRYGFKNIVVSRWLEKLVCEKASIKPYYIPNGIDTAVFSARMNYGERPAHSIAMLFHTQARKGTEVGIKAIKGIKNLFPDLTVDLFGSPKRPKELPDWIHYTRNANPSEVAEIFNRNRICFVTSKREGFGLTGLEAMACGAMLITTPCDGVLDYAINEENCFVTKGYEDTEFVELTSFCFQHEEEIAQMSQKAIITGKEFALGNSEARMLEFVQSS